MNVVIDQERVGDKLIQIQRFPETDFLHSGCIKEEEIARIEELQTRIALLRETGLETQVKQEEGKLAYYRYCLENHRARQNKDLGTKLNDKQKKILFTMFPVAYQWGFHSGYGDLRKDHLSKYKRNETANWQFSFGSEGQVSYKAALWDSYNFETIPTSVLIKIRDLQKDPIINQLLILVPEQALDPVLIANCYEIGMRLIARWGEALKPIKELDF